MPPNVVRAHAKLLGRFALSQPDRLVLRPQLDLAAAVLLTEPHTLNLDCTELCTPKDPIMSISARDVVPLTQASANLSEVPDQVQAGGEKIVTKNGESQVALIDVGRLERERIHLLLIDDARKGLDDIVAGCTQDADKALAAIQKRRG